MRYTQKPTTPVTERGNCKQTFAVFTRAPNCGGPTPSKSSTLGHELLFNLAIFCLSKSISRWFPNETEFRARRKIFGRNLAGTHVARRCTAGTNLSHYFLIDCGSLLPNRRWIVSVTPKQTNEVLCMKRLAKHVGTASR